MQPRSLSSSSVQYDHPRDPSLARWEITCNVGSNTNLGLTLPQHGLWGASLGRIAATIFGGFREAGGMVYAVPDLLGVHPDELLRIVKPLHLKLLLADRAKGVRRIVWHRKVLHLRLVGRSCPSSRSPCTICGTGILVLFNLTRFDPVLRKRVRG